MQESHFAEQGFVLVKNRSSKALNVTYNGRSTEIPPRPGGRFMTPMAAQKAIEQNRVMGTEDPLSPGNFESLVYVEGSDMPSGPREQSDKAEALDRTQLAAKDVVIVDRNARRIKGDLNPNNVETLGAHFTGAVGDA